MHSESSKLSGKVVNIKKSCTHPQIENFGGSEFIVEDWWDKVSGQNWVDSKGNPACIIYALRVGANILPFDNEVVYGKIGSFGHLVHISELDI